MASGVSETAIYNMVLDRLAEESVLSTGDEKAVARWLNRNYPIQRDALLQRHTWNFAMKRALLAELSNNPPEFEWSHKYQIPDDSLRVLPITDDGTRNGRPMPYEVEGNYILTNMSSPLKARYIFRQENCALFSPVFVDLLAQILASNFAHWLTGKASYAKQLQDLANNAFFEATRIDSLEGLPMEPVDNDLIDVR